MKSLIKYSCVFTLAFFIGAAFSFYKCREAFYLDSIFRADLIIRELKYLRNNEVNQAITNREIFLDNEISNYGMYLYSDVISGTELPFFYSGLLSSIEFTFFGLSDEYEKTLKNSIRKVVAYRKEHPFKNDFPIKCKNRDSEKEKFSCDLYDTSVVSEKYKDKFLNDNQ